MIITIASGKGGTGKSTLAVNMAAALSTSNSNVRLLDCDVEEPNDHLFVRPDYTSEHEVSAPKPVFDHTKCTACGKCAEKCGYNAIAVVKGNLLFFNELCHSCGMCSLVCPEGAINETSYHIGTVHTRIPGEPFDFVSGELKVGEALAPNVVRSVKKHCHLNYDYVNIIDAAPGTACPVVEAVQGSDVVILVTEPTPFGLNDLKFAAGLVLSLGIPTGIVVNRSDGSDTIIREYAESAGIPIIGTIPFRKEYAQAYSRGEIIGDSYPALRDRILDIHRNATQLIGTTPPPTPVIEQFYKDKAAQKPHPSKTPSENVTEVTIISGKGGAGKTTIAACFASLASSTTVADVDVDAADLHLLLNPRIYDEYDFYGGSDATIDYESCHDCGVCAQHCHFNAIHLAEAQPDGNRYYYIDDHACEGCGVCAYVCPHNAISLSPACNGKWYGSLSEYGPFAHARLGIAEENTGKLVTRVREYALETARGNEDMHLLADGSPGTGCPVIASISGVDAAVIVTEPTVSGVHDMERVLTLAAHFAVPAFVIINKADLNEEQTSRIDTIAEKEGAQVIGYIPFDHSVNDALSAGKILVEHTDSAATKAIRHAWQQLCTALNESGKKVYSCSTHM